jgi:putative hydrolase of the HAD superfamily
MKKSVPINALFLDIGGVLLTNGWDHHERRRAAKHFKLGWTEMEERHALNFETHEEGRMTFGEYLSRVVFYEKRPFTRSQFRSFMWAQSKPYIEMIKLVARLKTQHKLKIAVVSNESRELNAYRIREFKLDAFVDCFISSCFVGLRKPDVDVSACSGHRPDASRTSGLYRKHSHVRPDRRRPGDSEHSSH